MTLTFMHLPVKGSSGKERMFSSGTTMSFRLGV